MFISRTVLDKMWHKQRHLRCLKNNRTLTQSYMASDVDIIKVLARAQHELIVW